MKKLLLFLGLSMLSVHIFSMSPGLTALAWIIGNHQEKIKIAQDYIKIVNELIEQFQPASSDLAFKQESRNNLNKEVKSRKEYLCYLANKKLFFLAEIKRRQSMVKKLKPFFSASAC